MAKGIKIVPNVGPRVILVSRSGGTFIYDSYREFLHFLTKPIIEKLGRTFRDRRGVTVYHTSLDFWEIWKAEFVAYVAGIPLNPVKVLEDWREFNKSNRKNTFRFFHWNNRIFKYRYDPVPFIHKKHWHKGCYYRSIKTTQERRFSFTAKDDGVRWRGKRNFHNLPNAWDDVYRGNEKNWKRFRMNQWKN